MTNTKQIQRTLVYEQENIVSTVIYSHRTTIEFAVYPDATVIIRVPFTIDAYTLEEKIQKRLPWIHKKIHAFKNCTQVKPVREYIEGAKHPYLGRDYTVKILTGTKNTLVLSQDFFYVTCKTTPTQDNVHKILTQWYFEQARTNFTASLDNCWHSFAAQGHQKPFLTIRKMKTRWGSLSGKGRMTLNLELIKTPQECIDYVVMHELCHLVHRNHSADFYTLLTTVLPHWKDTKKRLKQAIL